MLYHVPNRSLALSEIRRVLAPGGRFYAATNGTAHMQELRQLVCSFSPDAPLLGAAFSNGFTLENGLEPLEASLGSVTLHNYLDELVVTRVAPLPAYVRSSSAGSYFDEEGFTRFVGQRMREQGPLRITKSTGLFVARRH